MRRVSLWVHTSLCKVQEAAGGSQWHPLCRHTPFFLFPERLGGGRSRLLCIPMCGDGLVSPGRASGTGTWPRDAGRSERVLGVAEFVFTRGSPGRFRVHPRAAQDGASLFVTVAPGPLRNGRPTAVPPAEPLCTFKVRRTLLDEVEGVQLYVHVGARTWEHLCTCTHVCARVRA